MAEKKEVKVIKTETPAELTPASPETAPFEAMDKQDDEQILAEIQGKGAVIADEWIYSYRDTAGKEVVGLSWVGTKNAAYWFRRKKMADLTITELIVEKDPTSEEHMLIKARCEDKINGGGIWGTKRQWLKIKFRDGTTGDNPFWYEQGTSKAQRNAMQSLMPADWIATLIKEWTTQGKLKKIAPVTSYQHPATGRPTSTAAIDWPKMSPWYKKVRDLITTIEANSLEKSIDEDKFLNPKEKTILKAAVSKKTAEFTDEIPF